MKKESDLVRQREEAETMRLLKAHEWETNKVAILQQKLKAMENEEEEAARREGLRFRSTNEWREKPRSDDYKLSTRFSPFGTTMNTGGGRTNSIPVQCGVCKLTVRNREFWTAHLDSPGHMQVERRGCSTGYDIDHVTGLFLCRLCNVSCNDEMQYANHVEGQWHREAKTKGKQFPVGREVKSVTKPLDAGSSGVGRKCTAVTLVDTDLRLKLEAKSLKSLDKGELERSDSHPTVPSTTSMSEEGRASKEDERASLSVSKKTLKKKLTETETEKQTSKETSTRKKVIVIKRRNVGATKKEKIRKSEELSSPPPPVQRSKSEDVKMRVEIEEEYLYCNTSEEQMGDVPSSISSDKISIPSDKTSIPSDKISIPSDKTNEEGYMYKEDDNGIHDSQDVFYIDTTSNMETVVDSERDFEEEENQTKMLNDAFNMEEFEIHPDTPEFDLYEDCSSNNDLFTSVRKRRHSSYNPDSSGGSDGDKRRRDDVTSRNDSKLKCVADSSTGSVQVDKDLVDLQEGTRNRGGNEESSLASGSKSGSPRRRKDDTISSVSVRDRKSQGEASRKGANKRKEDLRHSLNQNQGEEARSRRKEDLRSQNQGEEVRPTGRKEDLRHSLGQIQGEETKYNRRGRKEGLRYSLKREEIRSDRRESSKKERYQEDLHYSLYQNQEEDRYGRSGHNSRQEHNREDLCHSPDQSQEDLRYSLDRMESHQSFDHRVTHSSSSIRFNTASQPHVFDQPQSSAFGCPPQHSVFDHPPPQQHDAFDRPPPQQHNDFDHPPPRQHDAFDRPPPQQHNDFDHPSPRQHDDFDHPPPRLHDDFDHPPPRQHDAFDHPPPQQHNAFDRPPPQQHESFDRPSQQFSTFNRQHKAFDQPPRQLTAFDPPLQQHNAFDQQHHAFNLPSQQFNTFNQQQIAFDRSSQQLNAFGRPPQQPDLSSHTFDRPPRQPNAFDRPPQHLNAFDRPPQQPDLSSHAFDRPPQHLDPPPQHLNAFDHPPQQHAVYGHHSLHNRTI